MHATPSSAPSAITLFLCGDVMLGRGIDQVLPTPSDPRLYEPVVRSAKGYVALAERANGKIPKPVDYAYVWGDALAELEHTAPAVRIVNLETSVTISDAAAKKAINYRMHPRNIQCLAAAKIDCCVLANNHVLDWGHPGLADTMSTLDRIGIRRAGAGATLAEASAPAILEHAAGGRVLVFGFGATSSGIPASWAARPDRAGVNLLPEPFGIALEPIAQQVRRWRRPGDLLIASLHWGANWGYAVSSDERRFAHGLIDSAGFDVVHGHSSHHPKGIEVHNGKLVLYGCGDFINDYEGIGGREAFRGDLSLLYLPRLSISNGDLLGLTLVPFQMRRFQLVRARVWDVQWLRDVLERESARFGAHVELGADDTLALQGPSSAAASTVTIPRCRP